MHGHDDGDGDYGDDCSCAMLEEMVTVMRTMMPRMSVLKTMMAVMLVIHDRAQVLAQAGLPGDCRYCLRGVRGCSAAGI